jgi:restriction system protein
VPIYPPLKLTPKEYEIAVKRNLDALSAGLTDYQSVHREIVAGVDGEYEIDITVRFTAIGVDYLTLIECKRYNRPVGREKVQALLSKMHSVGAHKGIIFSTSGFQSGAGEFADAHGIALVEFVDGRSSYIRKSAQDDDLASWSEVPSGIPRIVGWQHEGKTRMIVTPDHPEYLLAYLKK